MLIMQAKHLALTGIEGHQASPLMEHNDYNYITENNGIQ